MKYMVEKPLQDFEFWSGAVDTAKRLTGEQFEAVEQILEEQQEERIANGKEPMTETEINDLFWFGSDTIYEWAGIYPRYCSFTSKVGRGAFVKLDSEVDEDSFLKEAKAYGVTDIEILDSEPVAVCSEWDSSRPDDTFWEEDSEDFIDSFQVYDFIPAAYENDDWTGIDDKDEKEFKEFVKENAEYFDETQYSHIWDDHVNFGSPDYGSGLRGNVVTLRIYSV